MARRKMVEMSPWFQKRPLTLLRRINGLVARLLAHDKEMHSMTAKQHYQVTRTLRHYGLEPVDLIAQARHQAGKKPAPSKDESAA